MHITTSSDNSEGVPPGDTTISQVRQLAQELLAVDSAAPTSPAGQSSQFQHLLHQSRHRCLPRSLDVLESPVTINPASGRFEQRHQSRAATRAGHQLQGLEPGVEVHQPGCRPKNF